MTRIWIQQKREKDTATDDLIVGNGNVEKKLWPSPSVLKFKSQKGWTNLNPVRQSVQTSCSSNPVKVSACHRQGVLACATRRPPLLCASMPLWGPASRFQHFGQTGTLQTANGRVDCGGGSGGGGASSVTHTLEQHPVRPWWSSPVQHAARFPPNPR